MVVDTLKLIVAQHALISSLWRLSLYDFYLNYNTYVLACGRLIRLTERFKKWCTIRINIFYMSLHNNYLRL